MMVALGSGGAKWRDIEQLLCSNNKIRNLEMKQRHQRTLLVKIWNSSRDIGRFKHRKAAS